MPYNAVELFEPARFSNLWQSYKYKESRGQQSNDLFIRDIRVDLIVETPDGRTQTKLLELETGNNGGYLNLVNPHYKISPVSLSNDERVNTYLNIQINTGGNAANSFHYGAWLDFFNSPELGGRKGFIADGNENNYTYNFVADPMRHDIEQLGVGRVDGNSVTFEVQLPKAEAVNLVGTRKTRLRLAVAKNVDSNRSLYNLAQDGIYDQGEVEDYLVELGLVNNVRALRSQASIHLRHAQGAAEGNIPQACPSDSPAGQPTAFAIDETDTPPTCNTLSCQDGAALCADILEREIVHSGSLSFNLSETEAVIKVDVGKEVVEAPFDVRTVSMEVYIPATRRALSTGTNTGSEVLYEEGGQDNGYSIRLLGDDRVEFGVRINGVSTNTTSQSSLPLDRWVNITAVFEDGRMSLYLDGNLEGEADTKVPMPHHTGGASWGGANETSIWGDDGVSNFTGLVDEFLLWEEALTAAEVTTLVGAEEGESANSSGPSYQADVQSKAEYTLEVSTLEVYPNPSSGALNIIMEIAQAGPVKLRLVDLSGKQVYEQAFEVRDQGHYQVRLEDMDLPKGIYMLEVVDGSGQRQTQKVVME